MESRSVGVVLGDWGEPIRKKKKRKEKKKGGPHTVLLSFQPKTSQVTRVPTQPPSSSNTGQTAQVHRLDFFFPMAR